MVAPGRQRTNFILMDVDGVLTDGAVILGDTREIKVFSVQDGLGIELARRSGRKVFFITNRDSDAVRQRAAELDIDGTFCGVSNKTVALDQILTDYRASADELAYIGDDLIDLPVMEMVECPIAVANAVDEVKQQARYVTKRTGGQGAVREAIEWILKRDGDWETVLAGYLRERGVHEE